MIPLIYNFYVTAADDLFGGKRKDASWRLHWPSRVNLLLLAHKQVKCVSDILL